MHDSYSTINFSKIFETLPGCYAVILPDLTFAAANDRYLKATMRKREEVIGRNIFDVFADNSENQIHSQYLKDSYKKVFETGEADIMPDLKYDVERPPEAGGGFEERHWSVAHYPISDADGKTTSILISVEDATTRKKSENFLIESEDRYKLINRATNDAVWDWNLESDHVWWNEGVKPFSVTRVKK